MFAYQLTQCVPLHLKRTLRCRARDSARAITRDPSREPSRAPSPTPMPRFERQRSISPNDQIAAAHLAAF